MKKNSPKRLVALTTPNSIKTFLFVLIGLLFAIDTNAGALKEKKKDNISLSTTVLPPPSNATCANATPLPCGTTALAGTTVATANIAHGTGCTMSNYGVWYTFVGDGQPTTITSTAASGFDHEMSISSGTCATKTSISCQDTSASGGLETTTFTTVNGTRYYVYIADWGDGALDTGAFTISRTCTGAPVAPANDLCANATNLPCGTTALAGTTVATTNIAHGTGCTMSNYGVWYTFVGDGQPTTITSTAASGFDHKMSISSGTCATKTNISCQDTSASGGPETTTFTTVNGTQYYVYIADYASGGTATGAFTISRTCTGAPVAPANDLCANATNLPCGTTALAGTTVATTNITHGTGCSMSNYGVWYTFVGDGQPTTITSTAASGFDHEMSISSGSCTTKTNISCHDASSLGGSETTTFATVNGTRYYVYIADYSNSGNNTGSFTISRTCATPTICSGTPLAGTVVTSPSTVLAGSPYVVSSTGYSTGVSGLTYQWQYSINSGTTWINAGSSTATYTNYNTTAPVSGVVLWHLVVTCTNSSTTTTSSNATFTTMVISDVVTGCPNVVSGGLGLSGADPATITCVSASGCVDLEATYLKLGNTSSYTVEPITYNAAFEYASLTNPANITTDDMWSPAITLPFKFCFYGNTYNSCSIGSNGIISFDTTLAGQLSGYLFNDNIPISNNGILVKNAIFGVLHDIDIEKGGNIGWELVTLPTGCRALVAAWNNVPMYSDKTILYTGMMVLYENSNIIEIYIKNKQIDNNNISPWNNGNAIVGIQNATGTQATVAPGRNGLSPNWTATNEAWRFVPSGTSITSIKWYKGAGVTGDFLGSTDVITVCPASTTVYTAEITYTLCDLSTITEIDQTTVTVNKDKTWNGSVSTNWNTAANWTPSGVPTIAQAVSIPNVTNDPIVGAGADAETCSLNIETGGVLTINSGRNIIVTNAVTVATGGTFNVLNSASLIQTNSVANSGIMNMQRTASMRKLDYVFWSSPVTFGSSFSSGAISPLSPTNLIFKWTPTIGSNVNGFGNWTQTVESMAVGKGYIVRGPNTYTGTTAPYTATFIGTPNNGNITAPIQRGTYDGVNYNTNVSTTQGTKVDDNWNLIGNPYPSAIKAVDFLNLNKNLDGFVMVWTHGTLPSTAIIDPFYNDYVYNYTVADYITYNSSGASIGPAPGTYNGFIPAGQGFFVSMLHGTAATNETVQFNNSMRSSTYNNSQFFRTAEENTTDNEGRIWLDLVAANGQNVRTLVAYVEGATNGRDRLFDAFTDNKTNLNLYSNVENEHMIIQGRTLPFEENDTVPMGIKVAQNGSYSITIAAVEGLFSNPTQNIYLEDTQTNIIHNLKLSPYVFSAVTGNDPNRFVLRYTDGTLGNDNFVTDTSSVWVNSSDELTVKSTKNEIKTVRVFDVLGRELANYQNINSYEIPLTKIQKNNSGLIIQVTLTNGVVISKKAIY